MESDLKGVQRCSFWNREALSLVPASCCLEQQLEWAGGVAGEERVAVSPRLRKLTGLQQLLLCHCLAICAAICTV